MWIDSSYKGAIYWTTVYHELRHVWQTMNGLRRGSAYSFERLNSSRLGIVRNILEYDAWKYTKYVSENYSIKLDDRWINDRYSYHRKRHLSTSVLGSGKPPVEISCCR